MYVPPSADSADVLPSLEEHAAVEAVRATTVMAAAARRRPVDLLMGLFMGLFLWFLAWACQGGC